MVKLILFAKHAIILILLHLHVSNKSRIVIVIANKRADTNQNLDIDSIYLGHLIQGYW